MNNRDRKRQDLLISLLRPLVSEWGYADVVKSLSLLENEINVSRSIGLGDKREGVYSNIQDGKKSSYLSKLISPNEIPEDKYKAISILVESFGKKKFLPKISDVRNFLETHGEHYHEFRNRSDASKVIVKVLVGETISSLEKILRDSSVSLPTELGPLSDAINAAGEARRLNSLSAENGDLESKGQQLNMENKSIDDHSQRDIFKDLNIDFSGDSNEVDGEGARAGSGRKNDAPKHDDLELSNKKNLDEHRDSSKSSDSLVKGASENVEPKGKIDK